MAIDNPHFRKKSRFHERIIETVMFLFALFSMLITVGIVVILVRESYLFFSDPQVDLIGFLTGKNWQPMIHQFGFLPLLNATFTTSIIAMLLGIPIGLFVAIYLAEYASDRMRGILKPVLEVLAGIPTIVYGYFALTFMTPLLRSLFGQDMVEIYNTASAGLVIGILVLPLIATMAEDAISSVPKELRLAAYALGGTKIETTFKVVIPAALSGLSATFLLAFSRAIGETMVVALAAGAGPKLTANRSRLLKNHRLHRTYQRRRCQLQLVDYNSIFALGWCSLSSLHLELVSRKLSTIFHQEL